MSTSNGFVHPDITVTNVRAVFVLGVIYFTIGAYLSHLLNKLCESLPSPDDPDAYWTNIVNISLQIALIVGLLCVTVYVTRLYVAKISTRVLGVSIPEVNGGVIIAFSVLLFLGPCIKSKLVNLIGAF